MIIHRRRRPERWFAFILLVATVITLLFVWWLLPSDLRSEYHYLLLNSKYVLPSQMLPLLITIIILLPIVMMLLRELYNMDKILASLAKEYRRSIDRKGVADEIILFDLSYLGKYSTSHLEKYKVLITLEKLAFYSIHKSTYAGASLEEIFSSIKATLDGSDDENILVVNLFIRDLLETLLERNFVLSPDIALIIRMLDWMCLKAIELDNDFAVLSLMDTYAHAVQSSPEFLSPATSILRSWGTKALSKKKFFVAIAVLNKIESIISRMLPLPCSDTIDYIGLLACFWTYGDMTKKRVNVSLSKISFEPSPRGLPPISN